MNIRILACALLLWAAFPSFSQSSSDALFKAAESGNVAEIRKALDQGIPVNVADQAGWTPLLVASGEGKLAAVQALVKAGANVNAASKKGETALMAAVLSGNVAVVQYLLSQGASKTAATAKGLTAADIAEQAQKPEIAKLLAPGGKTAPAAKAASPKQAEVKEAAAVEAYQQGRYSEAARLFKELVGLDPRHALAWHFLGQSLAKIGDIETARKAYNRSLEIEPRGDIADSTRRLMSMLLTDEEALAKSKNCLPCHAVDKKIVGPSYKDIAKKYAGQKDAETKLSEKVIKGSKGVWGEIPMPPNATVTPAESTKLVKWILSLSQ